MAFLDETGLAHFWNQILARLNKFVPAEDGKGLSSNDYTTEEKKKLSGIEVGANKTIVDTALSSTSTNPVQNKIINTKLTTMQSDIDSKADGDHTHSELVNGNASVVLNMNMGGTTYDLSPQYITTYLPESTTVYSCLGTSSNKWDHIYANNINLNGTDLQSTLNNKVPSSRTVNGKALTANITLSASDVGALPNTTQIPSIDGLATETYVDNKVAGLVDSAPATLDTLNELAAALGDDPNFATTVATQIGTKVNKVDGKGLSTNDYTTPEKTKLSGIAAGAEVNQNAFSNVVVGSATISADSKTDTLTLVAGSNITITPDATNDKITIAATDTTYGAAGTSLGLVQSGGDVTIKSGVITVNDDSHNHIIANIDGLQASIDSKVDKVTGKGLSTNDYTTEEKTKLSNIEVGANKTIVDSTLSNTSINPVQNKVINTKLTTMQSDINSKVPSSRTVNGKALTANITLSASDIGARPNTWTPSASDVGALPISGGTLTGNLTGKYITGTWLQSTADNHLNRKPPKVCVQDASGWVYHRTAEELRDDIGAAPAPFKPEGKSYLTFSSPNSFTLKVNDTTKHWDGTLEYFASDRTWAIWDGTTTLSSGNNDGEYVLYLRGTGNSVITGNGSNYKWVLTGSNIACIGNIETLLDYATVASGSHPTMAAYCYYNMFDGCTSLTQAPALLATTLANYCYYSMFSGCTSLTQAPVLPATTLAIYCYWYMFDGCTSLTQAPALPATTLASGCYMSMFDGCTSLTQAPALPATTLANYCYNGMFAGCTNLKLSTTQTSEYTQEYRIPSSGTGTTATDALKGMFTSTGGTFTGTPNINTTYYLSSDNIVVHDTELATLREYVRSMIDASNGDAPFKPEDKPYLTFSSPNSFTLKVYNSTKHWDGILEYFASDKTWAVWDGTTTLTAINNDGEYVLYLRGTGNTVITGNNSSYKWVLTGSDIACIGNIETLLDYATVASGSHPTMANWCYHSMFEGCTALTQAPALPATTLASNCYQYMFDGCTSLTQIPALPATTLERNCYYGMFYGCSNLKLSSTRTGEYTQEYRIPSSGTGTATSGALTSMFVSTGGTFTGTPSINTTYYLSSDNMIVHETETAPGSGYTGVFSAGTTAPNNTKLLWIDTTATTGGLKYYNGSAWVHVPVAFTG